MANGAVGRPRANIDIKDILFQRDVNHLSIGEIANLHGVSRKLVYDRLKEATGSPRYTPVDCRSPVQPQLSEPLQVPPATFNSIQRCTSQSRFTSPQDPNETPTADTLLARLRDVLGSYERIQAPIRPSGDREKILLLNDIHAPYHRQDLLAQIVSEEARDTDLVIIGGDLSDSFCKSRYVKYKQHFSDTDEFRAVRALLQFLAENFPRVILMRGNHDERLRKWLYGMLKLSSGEVDLINYLAQQAGAKEFDLGDPLSCLIADLDNIVMAPSVSKEFADYSFFYQHNDLIVSHAERFSKIAGKAADVAAQWFRDKAVPMGLAKPFRVLAQAHTHQAGKFFGDGGIWMFEAGCLASTPDYDADPKLNGAQRPPIRGYTVFYQENGVTDVNNSHFYALEHA
jgi:predicted phosphodiesterase